MQFEHASGYEKTGLYLGFVMSYFIFTVILYTLLYYLEKLPSTWSFIHVVGLTFVIAGIGLLVRWLLK